MKHAKQCLGSLLMLLVAILPGAVQAEAGDWTKQFKGADNNAMLDAPAQFVSFPELAAWESGNQDLASASSPVIVDGTLYSACQYFGVIPSEDRMSVKAFTPATGALLWESERLECGASLNLWSNSAPTVDPVAGVLYLGAGQNVYKLDAQNRTLLDTGVINATNTSDTLAGAGAWNIVNSAPTLGAGLIFVETYGGEKPANKQIVALRQSDLERAWYHNDKGIGSGTPCYVENGPDKRVYTSVIKGVACYNAETGAEIWNSRTLTEPWSTADHIYASVVHAGGKIFVASNSDSWGTTGTLVCADAATGAKLWQADDAPATSNPPIVVGGRVYVYGGEFGTGHLAAYNIADGSQSFDKLVGQGNFQSAMAATQDRIYFTNGIYVDAWLHSTDLDGNNIQSKAGYDGPIVFDRLGNLYARINAAVHAFGYTVPVELSEFAAE